MTIDFATVTELPGEQSSGEQIDRLCHRYYWAGRSCRGKDVIEAACGPGVGLAYLAGLARSVRAGDFSASNMELARAACGDGVELLPFDAQEMPFSDSSADTIILFEALYYLPSAERFVAECRRVLRPGGQVLIASANVDLFDFHRSPHSHRYYGVVDLIALFNGHGFDAECFGYCAYGAVSFRQRALRWAKRWAEWLHLIPRTKAGKQMLRRLVFGKLQPFPQRITEGMSVYTDPTPLPPGVPDREHKVLYCLATRRA